MSYLLVQPLEAIGMMIPVMEQFNDVLVDLCSLLLDACPIVD
jgi:hypothetical protein